MSKDAFGTDRNLMNIFSKESDMLMTNSYHQLEAFEADSVGFVATARGFNYFGSETACSGPNRKMTEELDHPRRTLLKPEMPPVRLATMTNNREATGAYGNSPLSKSLNESRIDHVHGGAPHILTPKNVSSFIDMLDYSLSEAGMSHYPFHQDGGQALNTSLSMSRIKGPIQDNSVHRFKLDGGDTTRDLIVETFGANSIIKDSSMELPRRNSHVSLLSTTTLNNTSVTYQVGTQIDERMLEHPLCKFGGINPPKKIKHSTKLVIQREHYPAAVATMCLKPCTPIDLESLQTDSPLLVDGTRLPVESGSQQQEYVLKVRSAGKETSEASTHIDSGVEQGPLAKKVVPFLDWTSTVSNNTSPFQREVEETKDQPAKADDELRDILQIMMDDNFLQAKQNSTAKKREVRSNFPILAYEEKTPTDERRYDGGLGTVSLRLAFVEEEVIPEVAETSNSGMGQMTSEEGSYARQGDTDSKPYMHMVEEQSKSELNLQTISNIENDEKPESQQQDQSGSLMLESDGSIL